MIVYFTGRRYKGRGKGLSMCIGKFLGIGKGRG